MNRPSMIIVTCHQQPSQFVDKVIGIFIISKFPYRLNVGRGGLPCPLMLLTQLSPGDVMTLSPVILVTASIRKCRVFTTDWMVLLIIVQHWGCGAALCTSPSHN